MRNVLTGRLARLLLSLLVVLGPALVLSEPRGHSPHLSTFFHSVDKDGDGQIEPDEAMAFMGDHFGDVAEHDVHHAVNLMKHNLDGSDQGQTISQSEVAEHLHSLLQVLSASTACGQQCKEGCRCCALC